MGFQTWSRGFTPRDIVGFWLPRAVEVEIRIGDVLVAPGDYLVGDRDGLLRVPRRLLPRWWTRQRLRSAPRARSGRRSWEAWTLSKLTCSTGSSEGSGHQSAACGVRRSEPLAHGQLHRAAVALVVVGATPDRRPGDFGRPAATHIGAQRHIASLRPCRMPPSPDQPETSWPKSTEGTRSTPSTTLA